ncbi:MAG: TrmH family RNA methyltransferase [Patescibacteria group bacterium]
MNQISVILPNIRSAYNVGSIFRTGDAIGIEKIYITGYTPRPDKDKKKITKTSLGAEQSIPWEYWPQAWRLIDCLKERGYAIVALEKNKNSADYRKFKPQYPVALILGHEVDGVSSALLKRADQVIHLPMLGLKNSLNVASAFSVIAYHLRFAQT